MKTILAQAQPHIVRHPQDMTHTLEYLPVLTSGTCVLPCRPLGPVKLDIVITTMVLATELWEKENNPTGIPLQTMAHAQSVFVARRRPYLGRKIYAMLVHRLPLQEQHPERVRLLTVPAPHLDGQNLPGNPFLNLQSLLQIAPHKPQRKRVKLDQNLPADNQWSLNNQALAH